MASLLVVLIIIGCAAYQYLKGTLVKSFATIIIAICASAVAFAYFEPLANIFINRGTFVHWAQALSFVLLFALTFAILQTGVVKLARRPVDFGVSVERVGRVLCGIFTGLIISGILLTTLAMAPLSNKNPYQRFDAARPNAEKPNKALFNADGFATGWFNIVSSGSLSGKRSFALLHPDFVDQLFLNRHNIADDVSLITSSEAIEVPKTAAWPATETLKDSNGKPIPPKNGHNLNIVRVGITTKAIKGGDTFTLSQLRLVCKPKDKAEKPLSGRGKNTYPIGYLKTANQLQIRQLNHQIQVDRAALKGNVKWIDFAFYVPNDFLPVLVEFKQNSIAQIPQSAIVTAEQAPPVEPFIQLSECATDIAELIPIASARIYGIELATGVNLLADLTLEIKDPNQWNEIQTANSIKPAEFEDAKINYVRAELKTEKPAQEKPEKVKQEKTKDSKPAPKKKRRFTRSMARIKKRKSTAAMLEPLDNYRLLSLKCNNPSTGTVIKGESLPILVEVSGLIHHPVGIVASARLADQIIYEFDYCGLTDEDITGGLVVADDGSVAQPFPPTVWLTKQAQSISEFYVLYLVKSDRRAIITAVRPAAPQTAAPFKEYEGFFIK